MPATSNLGALPRQELALAVVEGEGSVTGNIGSDLLGDLPISYRNAHMIKATLGASLGLRQISAQKYVRTMGTKYERAAATLSDVTLTVTPRGIEIAVPKEMQLDYRNIFDVLGFFSGRFGMEIGALTKELLIANALIGSSSTFIRGSALAAGVAYTAANRDTSGTGGMNPIQDIIASQRYLKSVGERPDTVAMSGQVWERVRTCQNTLQFVRGTFGPILDVTPDLFSKALAEYGITKLRVGDNYYNSSADGVEPTALTAIWTNTYMLVCKAGNVATSETEGSLVQSLTGMGATVLWEGFDASGVGTLNKPPTENLDFEGGGGYYVEVYPDFSIKSDVIRLEMTHNPTITNNRCGDLIATSYS
jgi:hypothetical protein